MTNPLLTPTKDPVASVFLYGTASDIDMVIIDGRILKENGDLTNPEMNDALYKAQDRIDEVWIRFLKDNPDLRALLKEEIPYM